MGSCSFTLAAATPLPNGQVMIHGVVTMSNSYATNGDTLDLSTYIKGAATSASFTCVVGSTTKGLVIAHNQGTATAGKLWAFTAADTGTEITASTNLSTYTASLIAIGPAY